MVFFWFFAEKRCRWRGFLPFFTKTKAGYIPPVFLPPLSANDLSAYTETVHSPDSNMTLLMSSTANFLSSSPRTTSCLFLTLTLHREETNMFAYPIMPCHLFFLLAGGLFSLPTKEMLPRTSTVHFLISGKVITPRLLLS